MHLSADGVHLGMNEIEQVLPPETLAQLERELAESDEEDRAAKAHTLGTRGSRIPEVENR